MKRRAIVETLGVVLLIAGGIALKWKGTRYSGKVAVFGPSYTGVISKGPWAPSEEDVATMEKDLAEAIRTDSRLKGSRLASQSSHFWRQYSGESNGGHRAMSVRFVSKDYMTKDQLLDELTLIITGGGDGIWYLTYDVQTRTFVEIRHADDM